MIYVTIYIYIYIYIYLNAACVCVIFMSIHALVAYAEYLWTSVFTSNTDIFLICTPSYFEQESLYRSWLMSIQLIIYHI